MGLADHKAPWETWVHKDPRVKGGRQGAMVQRGRAVSGENRDPSDASGRLETRGRRESREVQEGQEHKGPPGGMVQ